MYHMLRSPLKRVTQDSDEVIIPKWLKRRRLHKPFLRYHNPNNWPVLREALRKMGRAELIGNGKQQLVPGYQPAGTGGAAEGKRGGSPNRPFKTQHTGLPRVPTKPRHSR